jgi:ketosteroid isomerase-like protein
MDRDIRVLLAERAISQVMNEYCQAMDGGERARWLDCFTDDAVYEVLLPNGATYTNLKGRADFERFIANYPVLPGHRHIYVTPVFAVDPDAGTADVSSYWMVIAGSAAGTKIASMGRARDVFVSQGGRWLIKERRVATEGIAPPDA